MTYDDFIATALHGRTVNKAAKDWGIPQPTLFAYCSGARLPDYVTAAQMARDAGISEAEAMRTLAMEQAKRKGIVERVKGLFQTLLNAPKSGVSMAR